MEKRRKLSIIMPVYNEEKRIGTALRQINGVNLGGWVKEIIIVDDGSRDKSLEIIQKFCSSKNSVCRGMKVIGCKENCGKGSAIRRGISRAGGDFVLIQDADLEYDPKDIPKILAKAGKCDAVYGSRFLGEMRGISKTHLLGNKFLSIATSVLYGQKITDMETGYKLVRTSVLKGLGLKSDDFDIEPEITVKLLKKGLKICEVPIKYSARAKEEKKISIKDGIKAFWFLIKNRV